VIYELYFAVSALIVYHGEYVSERKVLVKGQWRRKEKCTIFSSIQSRHAKPSNSQVRYFV
jgi:hypothetical protein